MIYGPWKLFVDDVRDLTWVYPDANPDEWVVCRSVLEAATAISRLGWPSFVSFDHDLGLDVPTGYDLAKILIELDLDTPSNEDGMPKDFGFAVHSANPVGRANIEAMLTRYLVYRDSNG